jgi:phosphoglycolate phosphatase
MSLILFDFDGVLADTLVDMIQFGQEVCYEFGVKHLVTPDDLNFLEVMSLAEYGRQLEVPEDLVDEFVSRCLTRFANKPHPPKIFAGMMQVLMQLSARHAIGIITGNSTPTVKNFLAENNIGQCISAIFAVDQPGSKSEKISLARSQFAKDGESVFMVGDSMSDIRAAKEVSAKSIAVSWGHQSLGRLVNAGPDYVAHSPEEIIRIFEKMY